MLRRFAYWLRGFRSGHTYPGLILNRHLGNDYWVTLYHYGTVMTKQMDIHPSEIIDSNIAVMVVYSKGKFFMQVPVWVA